MSTRTRILIVLAAVVLAGVVGGVLLAVTNDDSPQSATAGGLIASAQEIASAPNANAKAGKLNAFYNKVDAQIGKKLTAAQADTLKRLAGSL